MNLGAPKAKIVVAGDLVEDLRLVKDEDEIRIMRRAMTYADFKVQAGREFVQRNGSVTEDEILKVTGRCRRRPDVERTERRSGRGHRSSLRRTGAVRQALGVPARGSEQGPA